MLICFKAAVFRWKGKCYKSTVPTKALASAAPRGGGLQSSLLLNVPRVSVLQSWRKTMIPGYTGLQQSTSAWEYILQQRDSCRVDSSCYASGGHLSTWWSSWCPRHLRKPKENEILSQLTSIVQGVGSGGLLQAFIEHLLTSPAEGLYRLGSGRILNRQDKVHKWEGRGTGTWWHRSTPL